MSGGMSLCPELESGLDLGWDVVDGLIGVAWNDLDRSFQTNWKQVKEMVSHVARTNVQNLDLPAAPNGSLGQVWGDVKKEYKPGCWLGCDRWVRKELVPFLESVNSLRCEALQGEALAEIEADFARN